MHTGSQQYASPAFTVGASAALAFWWPEPYPAAAVVMPGLRGIPAIIAGGQHRRGVLEGLGAAQRGEETQEPDLPRGQDPEPVLAVIQPQRHLRLVQAQRPGDGGL